jgi:DnaK suppressor protein
MTKSKKKLAVKKASKKAGSVKIKAKHAPEVKVRKVVREKPEVEAAPPPKPKPPTKELLEVRERLLTLLAEVRNGIKNEVKGASERDLAHILDSSDIASDAAEGDLSLRIAESEGAEAEEIEKAIEKIDNGTYGSCETCNKTIGAERLRFLPFATLCIKCQELAEIRRKEDGDELDDLAEGDEGGSDES